MSDAWAQKQVERFIFDFDRADKDKSGALSLAEVVEVLKAVGFKGTDDEARDIFSHLDKNKDDRISRSEFKACCDKLPKMTLREFAFRKAFNKLDKDQSGYLSKQELMEALKGDSDVEVSSKLVSESLLYLTKGDDDGKIAYDEFLRILNFDESASVLNQIFRRLDKDGSGSLTLDEINAAIAAEGELQKMRPRLVQLVKQQGGDPSKKINYHEFVAAWLKKKAEK